MKTMTMDGNTAAAYVSYAFSQLAVIYPITPSSPMAELFDIWATEGKHNAFGENVRVVQMQSESGVAGALHGALTCGTLATSFTCSQGLLLMQPNMFKIAGELLPTVLHVSARSLATHALNIFGDHQDVMACRQTGFAMLCSSSVQEAHDLALVAHLATLSGSVPFLHFFDGFRTSHEQQKIDVLTYEKMRTLLDERALQCFQKRALSPACPMQRGTTQNSDVYFQNREACNPFYHALPGIVQETMDKVAKCTGRAYHVFDYYGAKDAERVIILMGSACTTAEETVDALCAQGEKVGIIKVRLYRPFDSAAFIHTLPLSCKKIAVLDRTKEAGAAGEPLYLDVCAALAQGGRKDVQAVGGRYGLGMKEFTPSDCNAVFEHLRQANPSHGFTIGIHDDVSHTSLAPIPLRIEEENVACKFFGLGSDGTVGANKNTIRLIGDNTPYFIQAYFQYDSKKSGGITVSHLRFGKRPIRSAYLIKHANFIACHTPSYVTRLSVLDGLKTGGTVLLNCPCKSLDELNAYLPPSFKRELAEKNATLYVIDATKIAKEVGLKGRTSTVMQTAFFRLHEQLIPFEQAKKLLKADLTKRFSKKGNDIVERNCLAVDRTEENLHCIDYPKAWLQAKDESTKTADSGYYHDFMQPILTMHGDTLPVAAFSPDGSVPTNTAKLEKHGAPHLLPKWIEQNCIQCNQCSFVCPHACIRPFAFAKTQTLPNSLAVLPAVGIPDAQFRIQVSPLDCMGCGVCADVCPTKEKALVMMPADPQKKQETLHWDFCQSANKADTSAFKRETIKGSQFFPPLFEFSYACAGCGETPYIKVLTQLFGERLLIANATGCSSIYGGSAPACPYAKNDNGRGPAWANSLFEDNAEFGFGMQLAQILTKENASVWCIGGDGWAYDIGYGGLDHVLASGEKVRILVLDSQVYSNTGGQCSKATPLGATARFAASGKKKARKDLALMAMAYQSAYVAQVSMGADKQQLLRALSEAEAFDGPALIIAYSPCIAHGVGLEKCMTEEKKAVDSGFWHLFRFNPALLEQNGNPLSLDSPPPKIDFTEFTDGESRFLNMTDAQKQAAKKESNQKRAFLEYLRAFYNR